MQYIDSKHRGCGSANSGQRIPGRSNIAMFALLLGGGLALNACARSPGAADAGSPVADAASQPAAVVADAALPRVLVHKSPSCGCCGLWVEHLREAGFPVEVRDEADVHAVKQRLGVPYGKGSCHTAEVGGYVVEGHVPAADIKRLLAEASAARGLALPGMPIGSPGMEAPDGRVQPYTVELIDRDGTTRPFARHGAGAR